jgi:hypothetical protein
MGPNIFYHCNDYSSQPKRSCTRAKNVYRNSNRWCVYAQTMDVVTEAGTHVSMQSLLCCRVVLFVNQSESVPGDS